MLGGYALAPAVAAIGAEAIAFTKNPVAYCSINPVSCIAAIDTAAGTAAGVPVTGGTIPHAVPKTSAGVNNVRSTFLTADELAVLPKTGTIDPNVIRFSQNSPKASFKPPYSSVDNFIAGLRNGTVDVSSVEPIRLVQKNGQVFTLDNRRLFSFQEANLPIPYLTLDSIPKNQLFKFTTQNEGVSIMFRKGTK